MRPKFRKGWVYQIEFLDHVEDGDEPIPFRVYGHIVKHDKKSLTVAPWVNLDQTVDHNSKTFCILKSTILNADRLIPESATLTPDPHTST